MCGKFSLDDMEMVFFALMKFYWPHSRAAKVCEVQMVSIYRRLIRRKSKKNIRRLATFIFIRVENGATMALYQLHHIHINIQVFHFNHLFCIELGKSTAARLQCRRLHCIIEEIRQTHQRNDKWRSQIYLRYIRRKASQFTGRYVAGQAFGIQVSDFISIHTTNTSISTRFRSKTHFLFIQKSNSTAS